MKCVLVLALLAVGHAAVLVETPMAKVVTLLENMKTKIDSTGKSEQTSYDKFACWCEETMAEKASAITKAKDKLEDLQNNINKNKGGLGSGGAMIGQLKKDIAENIASQKEATSVRDKEGAEYSKEKNEAEQCIGALEASIKVLTGTGGKKFLQEAKLLSVVAGMRPVLQAPMVKHTMSEKDVQALQHFVAKPEDFVKGAAFSQTNQNPFGDYAPQSTQIQGILKSMYDSFTGDLEKDNAQEGSRQKSFEELMATKKKELGTLESSLQDESKSEAEKTKQVADDKEMRDITKEQLESDTKIFTQAKESCSTKAKQWAQRSQLRTKELDGITQAIEILSSDKAKTTFKGSSKLLQLSSALHRQGDGAPRAAAYKQLKSMATRYHSLRLAEVAVAAKTTGHFDDIIVMIDKMVAVLREEEQEDIAHRDRCEGKQNGNKNSKEDAKHQIKKSQAEIDRLVQAITDKQAEIKEIDDSMTKTKKDMDDITKERNTANTAYKKALEDDQDAIKLLDEAQSALEKFYSNLQVAADPAPNTKFQDGDYKGSTGEARGVLSILEMLKEDINKQIKTEGQDEIDAQTSYEENLLTLTQGYRASEKAKTASEIEEASLKNDKSEATGDKDASQKDLDDEEKLAKAIAADCDWVESNFDKRRTSRKAELDGLAEARDFLAGAGSADDLSMP